MQLILKEKKLIPLTEEELKLYQDSIVCYICSKTITQKLAKDNNYWTVRDHCHVTGKYRRAAHSVCNLRFTEPNKIPVLFHNGLNTDYPFIIKELAKEFQGQFEYLGENTEKYQIFSFPIKKRNQKSW